MGLLSGFIGGAAQAGGEILQRERESGTRLKEGQDMARFNDDLARKREEAVRQARNEDTIAAEGRGEERTIATETRGMKNRATERGQIVDETVANAPRLRDIKVEDTKATERAKYDPEIQELMRKAEKERLTAAEETKLEIYLKNKAGIIGQIRDRALAGHIDTGAGLRALQMQSEQIKLDMLKADAKLPPAVKGSIAAIQKQVDAKAAALVKAELEGTASPEAVKKVEAQIEAMNGEIRELYRPYLGAQAPKEGASAAPPARNGWDSDTGIVYKDGQPIGTAKSPDEARQLHKGGPQKTDKKPPAVNPEYRDRRDIEARQAIPEPPPKMLPNGRQNPSYAAWEKRYKDAFENKGEPKKVTLPQRFNAP